MVEDLEGLADCDSVSALSGFALLLFGEALGGLVLMPELEPVVVDLPCNVGRDGVVRRVSGGLDAEEVNVELLALYALYREVMEESCDCE